MHPSLTEVVLERSKESAPTEEGWVFANPITEKPYFPTEIQRRHIRPAGWCLVDCPKCGAAVVWCSQDKPTPTGARLPIHKERRIAAGKYSSIGWHTFRHTYRSWLDETGAPMKVQQDLMLDPDDDEHLWTGHVVVEKRSEQQGCGDAAQAGDGQRLSGGFAYWEFVGVCRSGQIFASD